jgi:hypothetical protein
MSTLDMVNLVAEATDGVNVWYAVETLPAHQYDEHEVIREHAEKAVRAKLATTAPVGLPVGIRIDRYTLDFEDDDSVCVDRDGSEYPEHDYDEIECRRCGAEPDGS